MTARDMFLDALLAAPSKRTPEQYRRHDDAVARRINEHFKNAPIADSPPPQVPTPAAPVADPAPAPMPEARPAFADDIDRIVRELVTAGDVVFDATLQAYRSPHCRRWRFTSGEFSGNNLSRKF